MSDQKRPEPGSAEAMRAAIDRALRGCPLCLIGQCRADAHAWLRVASGWTPPPPEESYTELQAKEPHNPNS